MNSLLVPAQVDQWPIVADYLERALEEADVPMKAQMAITVSLEEAFVNIAHYAYAPDTGDALIELSFLEAPRRVRIVLKDSGKPYDPLCRTDPDVAQDVDRRSIGGLGVFMVKKLMDSVAYRYECGENVLTLEKAYE